MERVHFYNAPVSQLIARQLANAMELSGKDKMNFVTTMAGTWPGENAVDTKSRRNQVRGRITLRNSIFNGWHSDYIKNCAALNLKQNVAVVVESCTLYDNEIAFRVRGGKSSNDGANVTVKNCVLYDNELAVRSEDSIRNFYLWNNTFGSGNIFPYKRVSGGLHETFQAYNNLFIDTAVPDDMKDSSNLRIGSGEVVNAEKHDYHLLKNNQVTAKAIDAGKELYQVTHDNEGKVRPIGKGYDAGAYEYSK